MFTCWAGLKKLTFEMSMRAHIKVNKEIVMDLVRNLQDTLSSQNLMILLNLEYWIPVCKVWHFLTRSPKFKDKFLCSLSLCLHIFFIRN